MTELPDDLATMPRAVRVTHALALARTAAEWVRAAEEQFALELEPGAAPTEMRDTAARILAWLAGADDDPDALNEDLEGHQMVLVRDRDAGDPDPYELLEPDDVLALAGISALRCAVAAAREPVSADDLAQVIYEWSHVRDDPRLALSVRDRAGR